MPPKNNFKTLFFVCQQETPLKTRGAKKETKVKGCGCEVNKKKGGGNHTHKYKLHICNIFVNIIKKSLSKI